MSTTASLDSISGDIDRIKTAIDSLIANRSSGGATAVAATGPAAAPVAAATVTPAPIVTPTATPPTPPSLQPLIGEMEKCREDIGKLEKEKANRPAHDKLNELKTKCALVEGNIENLGYSLPYKDNRKLFYGEHGQWARHYSTVRMTVMTLTVTTCTAIAAWEFASKPPNGNLLIYPVAILWMIGAITFWVFTFHTYKQVRSQQSFRNWMPDGLVHTGSIDPGGVRFDLASLVVPAFSLGMWGLASYHGFLPDWWQNAIACGFFAASVGVPFWIRAKLKTEPLCEAIFWTVAAAICGLFIIYFAGDHTDNGIVQRAPEAGNVAVNITYQTPDFKLSVLTNSPVINTNAN